LYVTDCRRAEGRGLAAEEREREISTGFERNLAAERKRDV
jgi:hypothetical protein